MFAAKLPSEDIKVLLYRVLSVEALQQGLFDLLMRPSLSDLGRGTKPRWSDHLMSTCAGVRPV